MTSLVTKILIGVIVALSVAFITAHLPDVFPQLDLDKYKNIKNTFGKKMIVNHHLYDNISRGGIVQHKVRFFLTNDDHEPIADAKVRLKNQENPQGYFFLEKRDGLYFLRSDTNGQFDITICGPEMLGQTGGRKKYHFFEMEIKKEGYKSFNATARLTNKELLFLF